MWPEQNGQHFADGTFKRISLYDSTADSLTNITATLFYKGPADLSYHCFMYWYGTNEAASKYAKTDPAYMHNYTS